MMRAPSLRAVVALFVLFSFATGGASAEPHRPDKKADAKLHYEAGIRQFDLGRYDDAAQEFVDAYELVGEPAILYNIAQAYRLGERFEKSAQFYRSFLRHMGQVSNRPEIEGRIVEMDERAADVKRKAERDAADKRDAERKAARQAGERVGGEDQTPGNDEPRAKDSPHPGRTLKITGYALCGFAVVSASFGIAMSVLASKAAGKVEDAANARQVFTTELRDTQSHGKLYDTLAIVGYSVVGAAAAGGAVAIYFGFRQERFSKYASDSSARRLAASLRVPLVVPNVTSEGGGLTVVGRF